MAERTRPIRIEFCVTEQERRLIQNKMAQLGTKNMGAYLRKMAIDGYIIKVDYTQQKKLAAAVSRAASNINQICRRINSTGQSAYMASNGKHYANHYATIRKWLDEDSKSKPGKNYDYTETYEEGECL